MLKHYKLVLFENFLYILYKYDPSFHLNYSGITGLIYLKQKLAESSGLQNHFSSINKNPDRLRNVQNWGKYLTAFGWVLFWTL